MSGEDVMEFNREALSNQLIKSFIAENDPAVNDSGNKLKYLAPLLVLVIVCFVTYAWYSDKFAISSINNTNIPLIRADIADVRSRPLDPGGMQVANRDKAVYETISNSVTRKLPKVVRILPSAEDPMDQADISAIKPDPSVAQLLDDMGQYIPDLKTSAGESMEVAGLGEEIQNREIVGLERGTPDNVIVIDEELIKELIKREKAKILKQMEEEERLKNGEGKVHDVLDNKEEGGARDKLKPEASLKNLQNMTVKDIKFVPIPKMKSGVLSVPNKKVSTSNYYRIQLGSYRNIADVKENWQQIKSKYGKLLGGLDYKTEKADLGEKGVFYRLKAGPFKKEADARKLCQQLRDKNQGCLFVRR